MDIITNRLVRQAVPLFNVFASVLLVLALGALLALGKDVFIPLAVALLLSFALSPVASGLQRIGLGRGIAVVFSVLLAIAVIVGVTHVVYSQVSDLAAQLPAHKEVVKTKLQGLAGSVGSGGPFSRASDVISELIDDLGHIADGSKKAAGPQAIIVRQESASGFKLAADALTHALHPLATLFAVLLLTAFMLAQREDIRNRLIRLAGTEDLQQTTAALDDAGGRLGKLLLTQLAVNACFGAIVGTVLLLIGVPSPFLWGILAGIFRFVPYVGAIIGAVPPMLVAFVFDPGWSSLLYTVGLFVLLDLMVGHVIEPMLYGHSTGLSPLAVVVSATIWAFLWGPVGLVLATPLTICLVVLGRYIPRLKFLGILLGDRPPLQPHEMLYQRMLAGDPGEATDQAKLFLQQRSLATYFDEVALESMRLAHTDIVRGTVAGDRLTRLIDSNRTLIQNLQAPDTASVSLIPHTSSETEAALDLYRDDAAAQRRVVGTDLPKTWQGKYPVVVLYGDHPLDEVPARMLAQVIERYGVPVYVSSMRACAADAAESEARGVKLVFLSFIEPLSTLHLRAASIGVRRKLGGADVALGMWQDAEKNIVDGLRKQLRVAGVVTATLDGLKLVQSKVADDGRP